MQSLHDMQSGKAVVAAAVTTAYMHMMRVIKAHLWKKNSRPPTHASKRPHRDGWCKLNTYGNVRTVESNSALLKRVGFRYKHALNAVKYMRFQVQAPSRLI